MVGCKRKMTTWTDINICRFKTAAESSTTIFLIQKNTEKTPIRKSDEEETRSVLRYSKFMLVFEATTNQHEDAYLI